MTRLFSFLILLAGVTVANLAAGQQFSQPTTFVTTSTNSPVLATAIANVQVPALSLSITVTNPTAILTNTFNLTNYTIVQQKFIFNAATMGTSLTTNFPAFTQSSTNGIYGQALQVSGNTNGATIQ